MHEDTVTTQTLLEQWREATRAAEMAERLAELAKASVERSDQAAAAAGEIAKLAERAAKHAERAARVAREAAGRAGTFAGDNRSGRLMDADTDAASAREAETAAGERYHAAERRARERHRNDGDR